MEVMQILWLITSDKFSYFRILHQNYRGPDLEMEAFEEQRLADWNRITEHNKWVLDDGDDDVDDDYGGGDGDDGDWNSNLGKEVFPCWWELSLIIQGGHHQIWFEILKEYRNLKISQTKYIVHIEKVFHIINYCIKSLHRDVIWKVKKGIFVQGYDQHIKEFLSRDQHITINRDMINHWSL